jgi:deoxyribose-phosphate aldolase
MSTILFQEIRRQLDTDPTRIAALIDHTMLKPDATEAMIARVCAEARQYQFASVCVNPTHVRFVAERLQGTTVKTCAVVGFPLGATTTADKVTETRQAICAGAAEIDMVINIGAVKSGDFDFVQEQISAVVTAAHENDAICKVIIETSYLSNEEKVRVCRMAAQAKADFVKTSTGFSGGGATIEDITLMRHAVGPEIGVKASGGIRSLEEARKMIAAGATRLGVSSGVKIMEEALILKAGGTEITGVAEAVLYVDDLMRARDFYHGVLGLPVSAQFDDACFLQTGRQSTLIIFARAALATRQNVIPTHGTTGAGHVAFAIPAAQMDGWRERLRQHNVPIEHEQDWPIGTHSLYFRDPDNNSIELIDGTHYERVSARLQSKQVTY